jgi:hypothetical protein
MLFGKDRTQLRKIYFQSWARHKQKQPMEPMETIIANLISQHPEYHIFFDDPEKNQDKDFTPEMGQTNPFLHLGMHIAIQEQLTTQRPNGINNLYLSLCNKMGDSHKAEHKIMDCLGGMLWQAQKENITPDENTYLECIKKLL